MPFILKKYYPVRNIVFFLGEGVLIFLAVSSIYLMVSGQPAFWADQGINALRAMLVTLIFQICLYYFDLYDLSISRTFSDTATRITQAFGVGCIVLGFLYYLAPVVMISTEIFWKSYLAICCGVALWRFFYAIVLDRKMFTQPILVVGSGILAGNIAKAISGKRDAAYKIVAFVGERDPAFDTIESDFFQDVGKIPDICNKHNIEKIVVALDDRRGKTPIKELMTCKLQGIPIVTGIGFYESLTGKLLVEKVDPAWIIFSEGFQKSRFALLTRRLADVFLALSGIVISLPITLLCMLAITLDSPGPVFYTQERVGEKGKTFKIIKFRSMRTDAEKDGPVWAGTDDDRVSRVGKWIRKLRIDEIPQLFNVLSGEMSFVGPRPERPVFVEQLSRSIPYYSLRHNVKPGITGWAQVFYPYGASEEDALRKLEYDLYYIKNMSPQMDLWIIIETIKIVLFQKGAR